MTEELEKREPSLELVELESAKQLAELLAGVRQAAEPTEEEMEAMRFSMIYEMAAAETEEELWREIPTVSSKDAIGGAFRILDARAYRSKFVAEGRTKPGAFLSVPAVFIDGNAIRGRVSEEEFVNLEPGQACILNSSAMRLCGRIGWYKVHGHLPVELRVVKISETANGYPILDARLIASPVNVDTGGAFEDEEVEDAELVDDANVA